MKYALRVFLVACVIGLPFMALAGTNAVVYIEHSPVTFGEMGRPINVEARVAGDYDVNQVSLAYLWYRNVDQESYDYVEMDLAGNTYSAAIPGREVVSVGMEYYIAMEFNDGTTITYPDNGDVNPVLVSIQGTGDEVTNTQILIISPEQGKSIMGSEVLVALAFNNALGQIDPQRIVLHVDGKDRTGEAMISAEVLTAVISDMTPGRHRIDLFHQTDSGREVLSTWFFNMVSPAERESRAGYRKYVTGFVSGEGVASQYSEQGLSYGNEAFSITFKAGKFNAVARGRFTSKEHSSLQPQHRFLFSMGMPWWRLRVGDVNPKYNELVLYGSRVRGIELAIKPGPINVYAVYGEMYRHVSGLSYQQRTVTMSIDSSNVVPDTSYNVQRTINNTGTFRRMLSAVKISSNLGFKDRVDFGYTAMKVVDVRNSVYLDRLPDAGDLAYITNLDSLYARTTYTGATPKDNVVSGLNLDMNFDRRRIVWSTSVAMSLYNDNTYEEAFSELKNYKNIIWINSYFQPLPDDGLSEDSTGSTIKAEDVAKSIIANSLSYDTKLRLRYLFNDLRIGYRKINTSYITLGNPSMYNDEAGYYVRDRIRMLNSKLYLNLGYSHYQNNVNDKSDLTLDRNEIMVGVNLYTDPRYPDFNVTYRHQLFENDGDSTAIFPYDNAPIDSATIIDTRQSLTNNLINVGAAYRLQTGNLDHQLSLNVITSNRSNEYQADSDADQFVLAFQVGTEYPGPYRTILAISNAKQTASNGETDINYFTFSPRIEFLFLNRKLVPYFSPRLLIGSGESLINQTDPGLTTTDPLEAAALRAGTIKYQIVDMMQIDFAAGVDYEFYPNHIITGYLSVTSISENGQWEYWNGQKFDMTEETVINGGYSIPQPTYYKRNDYIFSVMYTYKF